MNQGRIIVITGAPGTGKTTTASVVAKESDLEKSVHMHTDDFYHSIDIAGAARSILAITRTPNKEAPAERYMVQVKSNLAPTGSDRKSVV